MAADEPAVMDSVNHRAFFKTCSACGVSVDRKDCHRNRYGEYICQTCRAAGVRFTWRQRWRRLKKSKSRQVFWTLAAVGVFLFTLLVLFRFLDQMGVSP